LDGLGWLLDGNPEAVEIGALLLDDGNRITVTLSWRLDDPHAHYARWFGDRSVQYADDPNYTKFRYEFPECVWFESIDGVVALIGCRSVGQRMGLSVRQRPRCCRCSLCRH